jgi:hypothetical protein
VSILNSMLEQHFYARERRSALQEDTGVDG